MSRSKQYIASLLDAVPITELTNFEHRSTYDQIKERCSNADDLVIELKTLYRVNNFSDFALGLLWIADKVEKDPSLLEPSPDEQTLILTSFRKAVGDDGDGFGTPAPEALSEPTIETPTGFDTEPATETVSAFPSEPDLSTGFPADFGSTTETPAETPSMLSQEPDPLSGFDSTPASEPMADFPAASTPEPMSDFPGLTPELEPGASAPPPPAPAVPAGEGSPEMQFAQLVEKFVEAMQNGSDDRETLKGQVLSTCATVVADGSGASDDYKNFCKVFTEFITYISDNQFMDDIRVMNLCSNVTDPVWQWARADDASRAGMMDAAYDVLREYKSLFE